MSTLDIPKYVMKSKRGLRTLKVLKGSLKSHAKYYGKKIVFKNLIKFTFKKLKFLLHFSRSSVTTAEDPLILLIFPASLST